MITVTQIIKTVINISKAPLEQTKKKIITTFTITIRVCAQTPVGNDY